MHRNQEGAGWRTKLAVYTLAASAAGAAAGALTGLLGSTLGESARLAIATALAIAAIAAGAYELLRRPLVPLQCDRETPQRWMDRGPLGWAARNGASLGFGAFTRLGYLLWYVVPVGCLLLASPATGALVWAAYGFGRAAGAGALIAVAYRIGNAGRALDLALEKRLLAQRATAIQLLALGATAFVAVGL